MNRRFLVTIALAIALVIIAHVDPFGLQSATDKQSLDSYLRIAAPFYDSKGRDQVTVVLIDDDFLDRVGTTWPLAYRQQGDLVRRILSFEPRGVFLDILYERPHDGATTESADSPQQFFDALGARAARLGSGGVPFVLAVNAHGSAPAGATDGCLPVADQSKTEREALLPEFDRPEILRGYIGWHGCGVAYPLQLLPDRDMPTPAVVLYRDVYCSSIPSGGRAAERCRSFLQQDRQYVWANPMVVQWGSIPSLQQTNLAHMGGLECQSSGDSLGERLRAVIEQVATSFAQALEPTSVRGKRMPCPYIDTISASWLLSAYAEEIQPLLKGRIVLVGTHATGISDLAASPVNGLVPGVVWHAVALDNLISHGDGYMRSAPPRGQFVAELTFVLLSIGATFLYLRRRGAKSTAAPTTKGKIGRTSYWSIASFLVWLSIAMVVCWWGLTWLVFLSVVCWLAFDWTEPSATAVIFLSMAVGVLFSRVLLTPLHWAPLNWIAMGTVAIAALTSFLDEDDKSPWEKSFSKPIVEWSIARWQQLKRRSSQ